MKCFEASGARMKVLCAEVGVGGFGGWGGLVRIPGVSH